jgi:nucleoid DNA-binding protein
MAKSNSNKVRPPTKSAMFQELAAKTGLTKKQIASVFDALTEFIHHHLSKKGAGVVTLPGLLKIRRVEKPATKARQGINPRTGEPITIPAKPKTTTVRARPLRALKEMVAK